MVTEPLGMAPHQKASSRPRLYGGEQLEAYARLADAVESHDCRLLAQVQDQGRARHEAGRTFDAIGASRLPDDLSDRQCFVLDPMLATGGSLSAAIEFLFQRGAVDVTAICILGAPEGLERVRRDTEGRDVTVVLGALDEGLNEKGYIMPGLGDAGDRLFGTR